MHISESEDLTDYARNLESSINQIPDHALLMLDAEGRVMSWSAGAERLTGYAAQDIVGRDFSVLYTAEDTALDKPRRSLETASREGTCQEEGLRVRKDGARFRATETITALRDKEGQLQGFAILTGEITERKVHEAALQAASEARYRAIFENSYDAILLTRPMDGAILAVNPAGCRLFGYSEQQLLAMRRDNLLDPNDPRFVDAWEERAGAGAAAAELAFIRRGGECFEARVSSKLFTDESGSQVACTVVHDITERKQAEEILRQSEEKFRTTFEHAPLGIAECAADGSRFIEANAKMVEMLGYTKDELAHVTVTDLTHPEDWEETLVHLRKLASGETDSYVMEKRYVRKDRSIVWVNVTVSPIHGKLGNLIVIIEDITARKKVEEDLKRAIESSYYQATHDMLTGLANRASFNDRLHEALSLARRDCHLVAVHFFDLDRFKLVNDTLGHHIGDLLLKEVAKRIKSHIRATDVAARIGGDEFVVIQTHMADPAAAAILAGKLVEELGRAYMLDGVEVHSGASVGIAIFPNDAGNPEKLIKRADLALYEAKSRGRFNYQFYRKELGAAFREAQQMEKELASALRENQFSLYYQPQFDLKSGRIAGVEALLRWRHPARGMLPAAEFIKETERAGLILPIGEWILRTACRQYKAWADSGLAAPLILNLSSKQSRDPRFLPMLRQILEETGLSPSLLQLEMRESMLWEPKFSVDLLKQMKESGLHLALEEFGAEMTALSTLDRFPIDVVKPGKRLVNALPSGKREATMLGAIIGIAHDMKIAVCADGVETAGQLAAVKEQGCDLAQGYLLSSPLDAYGMERLIEAELAH